VTLLETKQLVARYGDFQALFGIDLKIREGEAVALIGSNGAGKSTTIRALTGLLPAAPDSIVFDGQAIGGMSPEQITRRGISLVPEGRKLFPSLTVEENLQMGAYCNSEGAWTLDAIYETFVVLRQRRDAPATALSGGQQQMVAIGRALMANPRLLICDEISLGLAPLVIRELYVVLERLRERGTTMMIVEQDIARAMKFADRVYCLQEGRVTLEGRPRDLSREQIKRAYFGV